MDEVEVVAYYMKDGPDGPGWYAWEQEYPEEGYFWVGDNKPSDQEMKQICPQYVLVN